MRDDYGDCGGQESWSSDFPPSPRWREHFGSYGGGTSSEDKDPQEKKPPNPSLCHRLIQKIRSFFN
ncbi:MAG: hypothetical protein NTX82_03440 [Candidatus Parcubacteria bacterium]|nr:hypothetical protein [Candidatus Parcubacteria bacterium]